MEPRHPTMSDVDAIRQRLLAKIKQEDYAGFDPYDGLNSRLFKAMGLGRFRLARLAWIQLFKRSPVNLRPWLGVPKRRNPKAISLIILGMLRDYHRLEDKEMLQEACDLGDWLLEESCPRESWGNYCWGYPFPWQARAFYVAEGTPNIITTSYAARALWALSKSSGTLRFAEAACSAAHFIAEHLLVKGEEQCYFSYIPGNQTFVHNASLWGAAIVALAGRQRDSVKLERLALSVARSSVRHQENNGSWAYGTRAHHAFVDGFHTGYNLEALDIIRRTLQVKEFDAAIEAGFKYYKTHFFLNDGTPKYYADEIYPIDLHSAAQAIVTLSKLGRSKHDMELLDRVMDWAMAHMYDTRSGWFIYQIHRHYRNRIPYMRWTQAWGYLALALYLESRDRGNMP